MIGAITQPVALSKGPTAEQRALLALSSVRGIGVATLGSLRVAFGSLAEALEVHRRDPSALLPSLRSEEARASLLEARGLADGADQVLAKIDSMGAGVVFPEDPGWPRQLRGAPFPSVLYVLGALPATAPRIAIVGARSCDGYGLDHTSHFAAAFVQAGFEVVSGGAVGVDAVAHRVAMARGGATVAVVGSGLDRVYPIEHRGLFDEIVAKGGGIVSLFPPGVPPVARNFIARNRLIAALADAVVVTRAGATSGALGTARAARALERPVFVVPGDTTSPLSGGGNRLLEQEGARIATHAESVLRGLGVLSADASREGRVSGGPEEKTVFVPPALGALVGALGPTPLQFDELVVRGNLEPGALAGALLRLELLGLCRELPGKHYVRSGSVRISIQEARDV